MTISSKMNDVLRVRSELLTMDVIGKIKGTAFILNALPDILGSNGEAVKVRVSTANYFTVREKGSRSRAKLNDDARSILDRVRNGELAENALTDDQKRTLAQYSGCGGGFTGIRAPGVDVMPGTLFHSVLDSVETPANITAPRMGAYARAMWNGRGGARAMAWLLDSVSEAERPAEFFGRLRSVSNGDY